MTKNDEPKKKKAKTEKGRGQQDDGLKGSQKKHKLERSSIHSWCIYCFSDEITVSNFATFFSHKAVSDF